MAGKLEVGALRDFETFSQSADQVTLQPYVIELIGISIISVISKIYALFIIL